MEPSTVINLQEPLDMSKLRKMMIKKAEKELVQISEESSKSSYDEFIKLQNEVLNTHHGVNVVHTSDELFLLHSRLPENLKLWAQFL